MARITRLILCTTCVFALGVLSHPSNKQAALAFTPTPEEACCMAVVNGDDAAICGETRPSGHECSRILENMSSAATRYGEQVNQASERSGKPEVRVRNANAEAREGRRTNILVYAAVAILVVALACASLFLDRRRLTGMFTTTIFLLNLMVFIGVLLYAIIVFLCRLGESCATSNLLLVYVTISIPIGAVLFPLIFLKYLRSANRAKMNARMLLFNLLSLAAIFIFKIGTS